MTRKRFVKLLMARGYSRDEANERAWEVVERGCSYELTYYEIVVGFSLLDSIPDFGAYISRCIEEFSAALPNMVRAISQMADATARLVGSHDAKLLLEALRNDQT